MLGDGACLWYSSVLGGKKIWGICFFWANIGVVWGEALDMLRYRVCRCDKDLSDKHYGFQGSQVYTEKILSLVGCVEMNIRWGAIVSYTHSLNFEAQWN